jgi:hypothetical protein
MLERLAEHPEEQFEIGRQRRREAVLVAATRYDEMIEREEAVRDLAWALFALDRVEQRTSAPVTWGEAQRRRLQPR